MKDKSRKNLSVKRQRLYSRAPEVTTVMRQTTGIKKLESGRYKARYFAGYDSQGKRRYPARSFDTQGEAVRWRTAQVAAKHSGQHTETHGLTVSQYLDQWLATKAQTLRENSLAMYENYVTVYIKPHVGSIRLSRLRPTQVEAMQAQLLTRVSGSTAALARVILNGAMKKAVRLRLIPINPVEGTDPPKRNKSTRYALTVEEALKFLKACEASRFGLCMVLALNTGLRPEELLGLTWPDLELDGRGVVRVWRVMHQLRGGGGWRWHEPKSESGKRSVVFPSHVAVKLSEHRRQQLEQKMRVGQHWRSNDLVFCSSLGTPIKLCALEQEFKATLKRAGLPASVRLYDLRHGFVTFSLIAGVDAKTVSYEAGHSDVGFTLQTYGSVLSEMRETASDKREELFKNRSAGQ